MGMKAVEVLLSLGEQKITVVTRTPSKYSTMDVDERVEMRFLSFEEWNGSDNEASMVISTVRSVEPIYHHKQKLPISSESTVMDFSWPPSIEESSIAANQTLLGMMHWIKTARNVGEEWDYKSIIDQSEVLIQEIENNFIAALSNRGNAKFRSFMYGTMEELSVQWIDSYELEGPEIAQLRPFSREIATWICNQSESFQTKDLEQMVQTTNRPIPSSLLEQMAKDVIETVFHLNEITTL
jgi:glutamyl-tRNA reductase